ncbi:MAG TPA: PQQ-binding-like beta-propeller repeat protein [Vicinamibacterales bacterium]|nr:PQQ-binding-like beta-propeller repeat protein [Vicinamibacterales bacterium]
MDDRQPAFRKPLRLWPGAIAVAVQWLVMIGVPVLFPGYGGVAIIAGLAGGLLVLLWWLFFSRVPWAERLGAIVIIAIAIAAIRPVLHPSITNGMMGFMPYIYSLPLVCLALVVWAATSRGLSTGPRFASLAAAMLLACAVLALVRTDGMSGDARSDFEWRWSPTAEEELLARGGDEPMAPPSTSAPTSPSATVDKPAAPVAPAAPIAPVEPTALNAPIAPIAPEWPGFRGRNRDGVIRGVRIDTDWSRAKPVELWRHPIGPGWSSFAVGNGLIYTQEQRGDAEVVSAYDLKTGKPVWRHRDAARFWESNAGPGPRGTPTLDGGRVFTLGATGILNALNAQTGAVVWSRNAATDTGRTVPDWGIASSPLVVGDVVIVAAGGWLAAYDAATGTPRWYGPKEGSGYSSPHFVTISGVEQVVLANGPGVMSVNAADGRILWKHDWAGDSIVQPVVLGNDLLIGSGSGLADKTGVLRINVALEGNGWVVKERWTSTGLKPYFNDFVAHKGHAYGFDGSILACIDLEDGTRKWKGGRYGNGQLVLLPEQDLLLVLSEDGELVLVSANADKFTEVARAPAIEGKTWNHPVLVGDIILVRNGEEMAAFRLPALQRQSRR